MGKKYPALSAAMPGHRVTLRHRERGDAQRMMSRRTFPDTSRTEWRLSSVPGT